MVSAIQRSKNQDKMSKIWKNTRLFWKCVFFLNQGGKGGVGGFLRDHGHANGRSRQLLISIDFFFTEGRPPVYPIYLKARSKQEEGMD